MGNQGNHPGCKTGHRCCQVLSNKSRYWLSQSDVIAILVLVHWRTPGDLGRPVYSAVFFLFINQKQTKKKTERARALPRYPLARYPIPSAQTRPCDELATHPCSLPLPVCRQDRGHIFLLQN